MAGSKTSTPRPRPAPDHQGNRRARDRRRTDQERQDTYGPSEGGALGAGVRAMEILAPEAGLAVLDPVSFGKAISRLSSEVARRPVPTLRALSRLGTGLALTGMAAAGRAAGIKTPPPIPAGGGKDRRFTDPAWDQNAGYFSLHQSYRLMERFVDDLLELAELDEPWAGKARFALKVMVDAVAPTNFLPGNPAALKRAFDTGGLSLARGARNFVTDLTTNGGLPRKVDRSAFTLGKNLAVSPGKVVFRNDLMELIQYAPATDTVHEVPLLCSPPWINKYYIMDLAPGRSFVEWATQHGHTVFQISYRNPDATMGETRLDDYLLDGPRQALDVINDITGSRKVNMVGLCLGGSLTAMLLAYLAAQGDDHVNSATFLNTLVDFSEPGTLGAFSDPESVTRIEAKMAKRGFLDSNEMSRTFDFLRANDLIWKYVASGWLMGEPPPAFDILAWNADPTRVSEATHSAYLRSCYLENQLAKSEMHLGGRRLNLDEIEADTYILAAQGDHITPWRSSYATTSLLPSQMRFVLTSSGHIAGIVNPPSPKRRYWTNDHLPEEADAWLAEASEHTGSWWGDWTEWIAARAGERREARPVGSSAYPPLIDAPGTYVRSDPQ